MTLIDLNNNYDVSGLIGLYLESKKDLIQESDSFNLELIMSGVSSGWRFQNIEAPSAEILEALIPTLETNIEFNNSVDSLRAGLISKSWDQMSEVERKLLMGMPVTKSDIGL